MILLAQTERASQPRLMSSLVAHGCRKCFRVYWLIEFCQRARKSFSSARRQVTIVSLCRHCLPGLISKTKLMVCRTRKDAALRLRSIGTDQDSIPTVEIGLLLLKVCLKFVNISLDVCRN